MTPASSGFTSKPSKLTGSRCIDELSKFCTSFQERRSKVTDEVLDHFMSPRSLLGRGASADTVLPLRDEKSTQHRVGDSKTPGSKNQEKKLRKLQLAAEKKLQKLKDKDSAGITGDDDDALHQG